MVTQLDQPRGVRIRLAIEELGPIFVKFGQSLSTRQDLLPADIGRELTRLQDEVPPFPTEQALAEIERSFGQPASQLFASFEHEALAAASIAQVHAARLHSGEDVVVKILRPNVRELVRRDLEVMYALARLAERWWPESRRLRPVDIVAEYDKTIINELDLLREAANATQLRRNWLGSPLIYVPQVYFDYCRQSVMVMERIHGIPIDDMEALKAAGVNIPRLAANGVEIFFTQVFRDNFFHADMHPGNIFVDATNPEYPRYAAVDFGIVGSLSERDSRYLAGNFMAFFERDYYRVAKLHVDSGWVPAGTRVDELEAAVRTRLRTDLQQTAERHFLRSCAVATAQHRATLRHGGADPADPAAEDAGAGRRPRPRALPRSGYLANRQTGAQGLDARPDRPAGDTAPAAARLAGPALCAGEAAAGGPQTGG